jgi:hypothetical protein
MMILRALFVALVLMSTAMTAEAQQPASGSAAPAGEAKVDVDRLPLDLQRLERRLRQSAERENWDGFRLRYTVEVFGKAPRLQFFDPEEVLPSGPIPYGAPTHKEMIERATPQEFRAPAMDFAALMRWLDEKLK